MSHNTIWQCPVWLKLPVVDGDTWHVRADRIESYWPAYRGKDAVTTVRTMSGTQNDISVPMDQLAQALWDAEPAHV